MSSLLLICCSSVSGIFWDFWHTALFMHCILILQEPCGACPHANHKSYSQFIAKSVPRWSNGLKSSGNTWQRWNWASSLKNAWNLDTWHSVERTHSRVCSSQTKGLETEKCICTRDLKIDLFWWSRFLKGGRCSCDMVAWFMIWGPGHKSQLWYLGKLFFLVLIVSVCKMGFCNLLQGCPASC